ncbi:MAG: site-specific DNA-methyltransferase [Propionibacteriaceae bacterium]|nr:site-specific DNA-methyltransferase [Propionibacteriaceae bacterium]
MSDKMKFETPNLTAENVAKIAEQFPGVVTEGKVNFDLLRSMLGEDVFTDEAYEFTWVGKRAAIAEAGRPIRKTLRPCVEESKDWDTTENLYIEGDNLDVLKLLQESYLGKVKMIYIDPPYNTGNDFVYRDDFTQSREDYDEEAGAYDEDGDRLYRNTETNGRFHSDWCSMIYPRLVLARNMLRDDGVIFISIDENEIHNICKLCDEILGVSNFIGCVANTNNPKGRSDDKYIATAHEYLLVYAKNITALVWYGFEPTEEITRRYNKTDEKGMKYREIDLRKTGENDLREDRPNLFYYFHYNEQTGEFYPTREKDAPNGFISIYPQREDGKEGNWRWGLDTAEKQIDDLVAKFMPTRKVWGIMQKDYLEGRGFVKPTSSWTFKDVNSERGTEQFIDLGFDKRIFPKPKPLGTIKRVLKLSTTSNDIILDFFSGSATTAHAVMRLNAEDGGKRKFIMVQLPEVCAEDTEAAKAGYSTICEIGKERIRRAGDKIKEEAGLTAQNLDIGFRVLKLDDTNMTDVYYAAGDYTQDLVLAMESNIKDDRTDMDLLYGCLLDWGLPLSMPHTHEKINGFTVHTYNDGDLIACFEENVPESVVRQIAERKPLRAVFRDSGFTSSPEKINVFEIFKLLSPNTTVKVI